jgi:hypothetical protein
MIAVKARNAVRTCVVEHVVESEPESFRTLPNQS